jgi:AhpD family alkylhydroperoxidase
MSRDEINEFKANREKLNELVMKYSGQNIKRFYGLDSAVFRDGALPRKTKELIGLVASLVLRCEECVQFHINNCYDANVTDNELEEALAIGLIIGGSITIPELRRTFKLWDELKE